MCLLKLKLLNILLYDHILFSFFSRTVSRARSHMKSRQRKENYDV